VLIVFEDSQCSRQTGIGARYEVKLIRHLKRRSQPGTEVEGKMKIIQYLISILGNRVYD